MSSPETPTSEPLTTTSYTLQNIPEELRPQETVACMNCPVAMWYLEQREVKCHCRILFTIVWETANAGRIKVCDGPIMAMAAAQE